jgi:endonuclease-3
MLPRPTHARREKLRQILDILQRQHGPRPWRSFGPCLDVLVRMMLAQNTNLANARSGYRQLRRTFPTWTAVMNAPLRDVQRCIAVCGLARMRARRLIGMLQRIKQEQGKLSLQTLASHDPKAAYDYLTSLFGIGPRTAAGTLLFAFGMPMFPVDNSIHRMIKRLKLARPKAGHEEASKTILVNLDPSHCYPLHVLMFAHAKRVCKPRNPKCAQCQLSELCPFGKARLRHLPPPTMIELPKRVRPIILSRVISGGIPNHPEPVAEEV